MRKYGVIMVCILILILGFVLVKFSAYYSPAVSQQGLRVLKHYDDTIRIGFIGDSWADGHKKTKCVIDTIVEARIGMPVIVKTTGISGLTSKNVYYSIFRDDSVRSVVEWGPDFCFVSAGINDSDRKMGVKYYKENMKLIINLLLENHIIPIILEIPSYNIHFSFRRRSRQIKLRYLLSMLINFSKMDCINDYREAYNELLDEQHWKDDVLTIYYTDWNHDGYKDKRKIYDEGQMHLNEKGYLVLDSCIANVIVESLNK